MQPMRHLVDGPKRAQVVCESGHGWVPPVLVREAADTERHAALELFRRDFGPSGIVAFGEVIDLDATPTIVAEMNAEIAGALAYRFVDAGLHIVALATDPMWQRSGVGGYLVAEAELLARRLGIPRVIVSMTNNLPSLYFYQRRGYVVSSGCERRGKTVCKRQRAGLAASIATKSGWRGAGNGPPGGQPISVPCESRRRA
jgi:GNAT superfamily N-acetyltransferase